MDFLTAFPDTSILQLVATIALEFCMNQILSEKFLPNITFTTFTMKGKEVSSNTSYVSNELEYYFLNIEHT